MAWWMVKFCAPKGGLIFLVGTVMMTVLMMAVLSTMLFDCVVGWGDLNPH